MALFVVVVVVGSLCLRASLGTRPPQVSAGDETKSEEERLIRLRRSASVCGGGGACPVRATLWRAAIGTRLCPERRRAGISTLRDKERDTQGGGNGLLRFRTNNNPDMEKK